MRKCESQNGLHSLARLKVVSLYLSASRLIRETPPSDVALQMSLSHFGRLTSLLVHSLRYVRLFTSSSTSGKQPPLPPRPKLSDDEVKHVFLKGSGPGGQKINKSTSAAQVTHLPTGLVVKSQATRSRTQNLKIARQILAEKIEAREKGEESRAAKKAELKQRRKASAGKKSRRKYRRLEEGREAQPLQEGEKVAQSTEVDDLDVREDDTLVDGRPDGHLGGKPDSGPRIAPVHNS